MGFLSFVKKEKKHFSILVKKNKIEISTQAGLYFVSFS